MLLPNYDELVELRRKTNPNVLASQSKTRSQTAGGYSSHFKGRGLDFSEFREYAAGDELKSIDWRVTARTGRAHTKIFTEERERTVYVIADTNRYMEFGTRGTFKSIQVARSAALISWKANQLRDRVGAILFGQVNGGVRLFMAKKSRAPIWEMLKALSAPEPASSEIKIEEALRVANQRVPKGSRVFLISDFFSIGKEFESQLGILSRRCEVTLVKVNDPADRSLVNSSDIRFLSDSGAELLVNTDDARGLSEYRALWERNDAELADLALKFRIKTIYLNTARDVSLDLAAGLANNRALLSGSEPS